MRRLTKAKIPKSEPTSIFVVCANDVPMSATLHEDVGKREVQRLRDDEAKAMKAAKRQKIGLANEIHYHIQVVPMLKEE